MEKRTRHTLTVAFADGIVESFNYYAPKIAMAVTEAAIKYPASDVRCVTLWKDRPNRGREIVIQAIFHRV